MASTRPAVGDDLDFAFHVTETAMRDHFIPTWGAWEPVFRFHHHRQSFDLATHCIVLMDGQPAGVIAVAEFSTDIQLEKLYLLPEYRAQGIGTQLFGMAQAQTSL
ncbi:GNAT family N-acetyltransferase [Chromobacterium sp. IIBBL 290-4]|uniref:GNAT family N-acetyltransferase n=1 Tax=Chromobacterium sp. IIBBL 290-4 TaxID=2953890 RepID=UPI0020B7A611|nr:GNAT family N-acetyltransferase [Chromobacterium sp. IIBBL 290-4]UTH73789.1 GNAT family N-acetyltransferase [Chromobacterium sp. IIBBL 290-4]